MLLPQASRRRIIRMAFSYEKPGNSLIATPSQIEGPFYPKSGFSGRENDLTRQDESLHSADGQVIYVAGKILNEQGEAIQEAIVQIWQAGASGRYAHPEDGENPAHLDMNFRHHGQDWTDLKGRYVFKTVQPGSYLAEPGWMRPPHLHFRVKAAGYQELITQLYFAGHPLNAVDRLLSEVPMRDRRFLLAEFEDSPPELDRGSKLGQFNMVLKRL